MTTTSRPAAPGKHPALPRAGRLVIAPCAHADWARAADNRLLTPAALELLGLPDRISESSLDRPDSPQSGGTA